MVNKNCMYGVCKSDSRYPERLAEKDVYFIPFPKPLRNRVKCERWIRACGRHDLNVEKVTKYSYICSLHFVRGNGPTEEYPVPIPAGACEAEKENFMLQNRKRRAPIDRPSLVCRKVKKTGKSADQRTIDLDHAYCIVHVPDFEAEIELGPGDEGKVQDDIDTTIFTATPLHVETTDSGSQTYHPTYSDSSTNVNLKTMRRQLFILDVEKKPKAYTGMTLDVLKLVFSHVELKASRMKYWYGSSRVDDSFDDTENDVSGQKRGALRELKLWEEYLMSLVRLRKGLDTDVLADMLCISSSTVSRIFTTWIVFLRKELDFLIKWPTKEQIKENMPKSFKYFPKTRVVIDCTEFFVQKPSLPSAQRITWSSYKHNNTLKLLVGITPSGSFCFLSKLWSGAVSDRRITQASEFLEMLEFGDEVMADRGFTISDLLALKGATLAIPPFANGRQLSSRAVTRTRRIANARIHVERAIGDIKSFQQLQGTLPLTLKPILDDIIFVCGALCNLRSKLVK
ncbi:uncharacterized protein LOC127731804 [Mytilus californianus]|uniref:uncharacterized protein LOC127731804 n=1 Tax=Mytilus californianus TaxID=6549 RepID=UPI002248109F|nr:uncharacterized protein LOC127731804 [Mytilus californianus]